MEYTLIKSKRKTIALQITRECEVVVRGPNRISKREADAFVHQHLEWIGRHLSQMREKTKNRRTFDFSDGSNIYILGQKRTLHIREGNMEIKMSGEELFIPSSENMEFTLKKILGERLREILPGLVQKWSDFTGLIPVDVKITGAKTHWGSCSGKNRVCFSWRLACLDISLIDYVVLHELCHIKHHNHSANFYALLKSFMPDYENRVAALRKAREIVPF